jgi:hypothetical protein
MNFNSEPPPGWQREVPRYRATRDIHPSPNTRHRFEPPFAAVWDDDMWQYGTQPIAAREEIETREWPHPSFRPLNYSAGRKQLAIAAARAGAVKGELLDSDNEMVRDRASTFVLGLADIAPASAPSLSVNLEIRAGYVIDISPEPGERP